MDYKKIKKIHFTGIKGVGMAPLAIIAKEAGFKVTGSDVSDVFITDKELKKAGIENIHEFEASNVEGVDLLIATAAHGGSENLEVVKAKELGIKVLNQGQALGVFQKGEIFGKKLKGISVAGSHGKTTTTAMIATVFENSGLKPSYVIGTSDIPSLGSSGHFGKGEYFITESDEYFADIKSDLVPKFLYQSPEILVVTNIDFDHPDIYGNLEEIKKVFIDFTKKLSSNGVLIACGDGGENRDFLKRVEARKITYGTSPDNDYILERASFTNDKMFFWVKSHGADLGQFSMSVFGEQNAVNALGAIVVGIESGLTVEQIRNGLSKFKGTKRRSEFIGNLPGGSLLYDDYAHHPVEIKNTLSAFRKAYPKHKIIPIFQPHMYSRTKALFTEFSTAFSDADQVLIVEIFPSFREEIDDNFSSLLLVEEVKKFGKDALFFPTLMDVVKYVTSQKFDKNTIIITMGAGDVYKIGEEILNG